MSPDLSQWFADLKAEMDAERWEARITRGGRWTWHIDPVKGLTGLREGYLAFGSELHAERKARRIISRLNRDDDRRADVKVIT